MRTSFLLAIATTSRLSHKNYDSCALESPKASGECSTSTNVTSHRRRREPVTLRECITGKQPANAKGSIAIANHVLKPYLGMEPIAEYQEHRGEVF